MLTKLSPAKFWIAWGPVLKVSLAKTLPATCRSIVTGEPYCCAVEHVALFPPGTQASDSRN